jgi:hypothetical protein
LNGHWESLPASVTEFGKYPEEIFSGWEAVKSKVGEKAMKEIPFGAVAMFGYIDKLSCGLQQFMAGARKFKLSSIGREDLMASNRETEELTGIPFMTDALDKQAKAILTAK